MEIVLNYFDKGGIVFLALGFLSIISIAIIIYKFLDIYFFNDLNLKKFLKDSSDVNSLEEVENLISDSEGKKSFILNEIKQLLEGLKKSSKKDDEVYFYLNEKFKKIQFLMPSLEIISQVSPLIGLLGTVVGMIDSFNELRIRWKSSGPFYSCRWYLDSPFNYSDGLASGHTCFSVTLFF